ncbi:MAG: PQQ-dependent sugar dehydrogenase [Planctomycetales bacterium]|nr:PQQ-dependent sugar dehydrogenase [Planctomycetales bacterium]
MKAEDLCVFLTVYSLCVAFSSVWAYSRRRTMLSLMNVLLALAAVFASTIVGFYLDSEQNYLQFLLFLVSERDFSAAVSAAFGGAAAITWMLVLPVPGRTESQFKPARLLNRNNVVQGALAVSLVGVFGCAQMFIVKELRGIKRDPAVRVHAAEFMIEKVADLEFLPIRIAISDDDRIFVTYSYFEDWGDMGGAIVELKANGASGRFHSRIVADSPLLMRSYGLASRDGDLYVSRTGLASHAKNGRISYDNTGAITRLQDLDGDGYFEYADDVVTSLPGARGPDTMHQNNGIAFTADGSLYVLSAGPDDRALDDHPWGGKVLLCSPDFSSTEVFAEGFRNPFGVMIGPEGELFVTDNDVDESPGDELNHVVRDAHYGHPFVVPNEPSVESSGFRAPILLGEHESNYLGMVYATSPALPDEYRNCVYMVDFMQNQILRLKLERVGDTFEVTEMEPFATVTSPVDIAVSSKGEFYCLSRRTQNVYRIRLKQQRATQE